MSVNHVQAKPYLILVWVMVVTHISLLCLFHSSVMETFDDCCIAWYRFFGEKWTLQRFCKLQCKILKSGDWARLAPVAGMFLKLGLLKTSLNFKCTLSRLKSWKNGDEGNSVYAGYSTWIFMASIIVIWLKRNCCPWLILGTPTNISAPLLTETNLARKYKERNGTAAVKVVNVNTIDWG